MFSLPYSDQQLLALEALQLFAPLGHALGLGAVSSRVEDLCFKVLFPASYSHTSEWLHDVADVAEDALFACQQQLLVALDEHPRFKQLAAGCVVSTLACRCQQQQTSRAIMRLRKHASSSSTL